MGRELDYEALKTFVIGYCDGSIPDYQASALLMAMFLKGMSHRKPQNLQISWQVRGYDRPFRHRGY